MAITITRDLNVVPIGVPPVIHLSQYDSDFTLVFNLYASTGALTIPSGTTAEIRGTKRDGNGYDADATVSGTTVTVTGDVQMTAIAGANIYELALYKNSKQLFTSNFILAVEPSALDGNTITSESVLKELNAIIAGAETATQAAEDAEASANAAAVSAEALEHALPFTSDAKTALLECLQHVAWTNEHGQDYYDAFNNALSPKALSSITAVFTQGSAVIYADDDLDVLKQYLVVTATYTDQTTAQVYGYTLSGTLTQGTSTITVNYGGKTDTFNVTVSAPYWNYFTWNASSQTLPEGMTAYSYNFSDTPGAMRVYQPNWQMSYTEEVEIDAEFMFPYVDAAWNPRFRIQNADNNIWACILGNVVPRTHKIATDITGSFVDTAYTQDDTFHTVHFSYADGTFEAYFDGDESTKITGTGRIPSPAVSSSIVEINSASDPANKFNMYIKSLNVKAR